DQLAVLFFVRCRAGEDSRQQQHHGQREGQREDRCQRVPREKLQLCPGQRPKRAHRLQPYSRTERPVNARKTFSSVGRSARKSTGTMPCSTSLAATSASTAPVPSTTT